MIAPSGLLATPNPLASRYTRFRVAERFLFTGHSHQAWPDRAFEGQVRAFNDAAELADGKWERAFAMADRVRRGFAGLLGDVPERIALGPSTFDLVLRFLSGLPLRERPRLVTTDGEFHTIRRLLDRIAEEGVEVVKIPADDAPSLAPRLAAAVDGRTAAVLVSAVLFRDARIVPGLRDVASACERAGTRLLVDAYHALGAIPFDLAGQGLAGACVVGGGYKYLQLGEGNCFLRFPEGCDMRPVATGWFSEFDELAAAPVAGRTPYGRGPLRFAGSTYDPVSHYRAAEVFDFFEEAGLTPRLLREVSLGQTGRLAERFDALDLDPAIITRDRSAPRSMYGGFLALRSPFAGPFCRELGRRGVLADFRGDVLRLGPAPYLSTAQLDAAIGLLGETVSDTR
jgi:kynureninase